MAIGIEYNTSDTVEGKKGSSTNLVIDLSKIEGLLRTGKTTEELKNKINTRAENEVSSDLNSIKQHLSQGKSFDNAMDLEFNKNDSQGLQDILKEYVDVVQESSYSLSDLANQIDFQLTDAGKIKIPGNITTTAEQSVQYYQDIKKSPEDCVQNFDISQKIANPSMNNSSVPNQVVAYRNTNGYEGVDDLSSRDKDYTKSDAKRALREMMKGKNDDLDFVAEGDKVGDRKVDLATKSDKQYLKEYFFKPLKRLCIHTDGGLFERSVSENGLNPSAVWREIVSAFDSGKDVTSSATWKEIFKTTNLPVTRSGNNERQFGNWMSQLGTLYTGYRSEKGEFDKSTYIGKLVGQLDNELLRNEDDYSVATGKEGVTKFYNNSNNKIKDILFSGDHKILDGKSDENKAERKLSELNISKDQAIKYGQSAVETYNVKILNDFADPKNMTREEQFVNFLGDTSFNGNVDNSDVGTRSGMQIVSQYRSAVEQYALLNNVSPKQAQGAVILNIISFLQRQSGININLKDGGNLANRLCNVVSGGADCIGKNLVGPGSLLSNHPEILKFMQDKLMSHPGALDGILLYGSQGESKMQEEYRNAKIAPVEYVQAVDSCGEKVPSHNREAVKNVMKNNASEIEKMVKSMRTTNAMSEQQLLQNIALNISNVLTENAPMVWNTLSGSEREFATKRANTLTKDTQVKIGDKPFTTSLNGVEVSGALGLGASLALAKNIKLNYGVATDGSTLAPSLGISAQQDLGSGRRAGEQVHLIVPGFSGTITKTFDKGAKVSGDLDTVAAKKVTIGVDGNISVLGVGAGLGFFKEKDFVSGIETGYTERLSAGEKIISSIVKGIDLGAIKDTAVLHEKIRASINSLYGQKSDPAKIDAMTESLYAAMLSYNSGNLANINPDVLTSQLSQAFAGEWRNQSTMALKGTKLTGRGMRLGVNTNPWEQALNILTLGTSLKFTNFNRGLHYETTAASLQEMHDAEFSGKNTRRLSDGIGSREVDMMNRLFESVHNTTDKLPDIMYDESKNIVRIPQGLWNKQSFVTPTISSSLKGKVMIDTNGDLVVPANVPVSLNAFYQQSGAEYILSFGSQTVDSNALKLRTGTTLPLDRQASSLDGVKFEGINKANNLTKEKVQSVIDSMKAKKGFENFNVQVISADNYKIKLSINGVVQEFDSSRELTVVMSNKILSVVQGNESKGKLSLKFDNKDNTSTTKPNEKDIPLGTLEYREVDTEKAAMDEINANLSLIEKIENQNDDNAKEGFYQFMNNVMHHNTEGAAGYLVDMFAKSNKMPNLITILKSGSLAEKEVIVSRMLSVFALEDISYKGKTLESIMNSRDLTSKNSVPAYQRLGTTPMNFVSRDDIKSWFNAKEVKHGSKVDMPNVLGYTAFYRRSLGGNKDHRGYALTTPGYTNSLVPPHDLTGDKRNEAMKWLAAEINQDKFANRAIKDALTNKLKDYGVVSDENVVSIMQGASEIKLGNGTIVKLSTTPVFYFLAECANESIGLRIDSMVVQQGGSDVIINTDLTDTSTIDFGAGGGGFYMNTTEGRGVGTVTSGNSRQVGMGAGAKFGGNTGGRNRSGLDGNSNPTGGQGGSTNGGNTNTGGSTGGSSNSSGSGE